MTWVLYFVVFVGFPSLCFLLWKFVGLLRGYESIMLVRVTEYKGEEIDLQPTVAMQKRAQKGLEWRKEFGRGGTLIGVARANQLVRRDELSPSVVRRMKSYFDRHAVDLEAPKNKDPDADGYPGAGLIAWYLWGGDEGQRWSARKVAQMNAIDERQEKRAEPDELEIGDFVNWNTEKGKYLGRVVSIRFEGSTMVGDEEVEASPDDPVARIRVFARVEEDLVETDRYVAFPFSRLTKAPAPEDYRQERQLSDQVETALKNKLEEHNDEVGSDRRKRTTLGALRKVFERGVGAYKGNPSSVRPTVGNAEQWAFARVNSFLYCLKNLKFRRGQHDTDLLPAAHPLSTKGD